MYITNNWFILNRHMFQYIWTLIVTLFTSNILYKETKKKKPKIQKQNQIFHFFLQFNYTKVNERFFFIVAAIFFYN